MTFVCMVGVLLMSSAFGCDGCAGPTSETDAGTKGASSSDSGPSSDAGTQDAGTFTDGGDAGSGAPVDSGFSDASMNGDAGEMDAGVEIEPALDAGPASDAGLVDGGTSSGADGGTVSDAGGTPVADAGDTQAGAPTWPHEATVTIQERGDAYLRLSWPMAESTQSPVGYVLTWGQNTELQTHENHVVIRDLAPSTEYVIAVYARDPQGRQSDTGAVGGSLGYAGAGLKSGSAILDDVVTNAAVTGAVSGADAARTFEP